MRALLAEGAFPDPVSRWLEAAAPHGNVRRDAAASSTAASPGCRSIPATGGSRRRRWSRCRCFATPPAGPRSPGGGRGAVRRRPARRARRIRPHLRSGHPRQHGHHRGRRRRDAGGAGHRKGRGPIPDAARFLVESPLRARFAGWSRTSRSAATVRSTSCSRCRSARAARPPPSKGRCLSTATGSTSPRARPGIRGGHRTIAVPRRRHRGRRRLRDLPSASRCAPCSGPLPSTGRDAPVDRRPHHAAPPGRASLQHRPRRHAPARGFRAPRAGSTARRPGTRPSTFRAPLATEPGHGSRLAVGSAMTPAPVRSRATAPETA